MFVQSCPQKNRALILENREEWTLPTEHELRASVMTELISLYLCLRIPSKPLLRTLTYRKGILTETVHYLINQMVE